MTCCGDEPGALGFFCFECWMRVEFALGLYPALAAYLETAPERVRGEPVTGGGFGSTVLVPEAVQSVNVCDSMLARLVGDEWVGYPYSSSLAGRVRERLPELAGDKDAVNVLKMFAETVNRLVEDYPTFERPRIIHIACQCGAKVMVRTPPDKFGDELLVTCPACGFKLSQTEYEAVLKETLKGMMK